MENGILRRRKRSMGTAHPCFIYSFIQILKTVTVIKNIEKRPVHRAKNRQKRTVPTLRFLWRMTAIMRISWDRFALASTKNLTPSWFAMQVKYTLKRRRAVLL